MTLATGLYLVLGAVVVVALALARGPLLALVNTPATLHPEAGRALVVMGATLAVANLVTVAAGVFAGRQRMDLSNRLVMLVTALQLVGTIVVLARGGGLVALAGVALAAQGAGALTGFAMLRRHVPALVLDGGAVTRPLLRALSRYGLALQITNLGTLAQFQLDKLLLAHFVALGAVTPFELGFRLASAVWVAPMLMLPPLIPAFAQLSATGDRQRLLRLYHRASRYVAAIAYPLAAFVVVASVPLVTLWLGPGHPQAALATAGLSMLLWVSLHTGVATAALRGMGVPGREARYHVVAMGLHVAASLWAVPRWGLTGALVATAVSTAVAAVWLLHRFHRDVGESSRRWLWDTVRVPLLCSVAAGVAVWLIEAGWDSPSSGRGAALGALARAAAVFAAVVGFGYVATGFVRLAELRGLTGGVPAEVADSMEPR